MRDLRRSKGWTFGSGYLLSDEELLLRKPEDE